MDFVMMWKPVFFLSQWFYWHYKAGVYVLEWVRLHMPFAHWSQRRSLFKYVTTLRNEFFFFETANEKRKHIQNFIVNFKRDFLTLMYPLHVAVEWPLLAKHSGSKCNFGTFIMHIFKSHRLGLWMRKKKMSKINMKNHALQRC